MFRRRPIQTAEGMQIEDGTNSDGQIRKQYFPYKVSVRLLYTVHRCYGSLGNSCLIHFVATYGL